MMKAIAILTILLCVNSCSAQLPLSNEEKCIISRIDSLKLENLSTDLLGDWVYNYSYFDDTCFQLDNLGDLSRYYYFRNEDTSLIHSKLPKLYSFGYGKMLFGLICSHEDKPFGKESYPIANNSTSEDGVLKHIRITHYVGNGPGKAYTYFLESLGEEILVLFNERYYQVGERKISEVRHVYVRQKQSKEN